jgi:hypothetical protein
VAGVYITKQDHSFFLALIRDGLGCSRNSTARGGGTHRLQHDVVYLATTNRNQKQAASADYPDAAVNC